MPGRIGLVVIHGMGAQQTDFADALMADVLSRMGADGNRVVWKPIYWAQVLEPRESALWTAMTGARDPAGKSVALASTGAAWMSTRMSESWWRSLRSAATFRCSAWISTSPPRSIFRGRASRSRP